MNEKELMEHIFELSYALDYQSANRDLAGLRNTHYKNQTWIHDHSLTEEYYQFYMKIRMGEKK